jgi:hypothetical protein
MTEEQIREILDTTLISGMAIEGINQAAEKIAALWNDVYHNPFGCFHPERFIWTDPAGQTACAACRMFVAEKLEKERGEANDK